MNYLVYTGPSRNLYTHNVAYKVISESHIGWMIKDNEGVTTNVSKVNNFYWDVYTGEYHD